MPIFLSYCTFSSKCFFFFFFLSWQKHSCICLCQNTSSSVYKPIYFFLLGFSFALRLLSSSLSLLAVISDLHCTSVRNPPTACFNNMLVWLKGKFCCVSFLSENKHTNKQTKTRGGNSLYSHFSWTLSTVMKQIPNYHAFIHFVEDLQIT